jgi:hypothetical protein
MQLILTLPLCYYCYFTTAAVTATIATITTGQEAEGGGAQVVRAYKLLDVQQEGQTGAGGALQGAAQQEPSVDVSDLLNDSVLPVCPCMYT